MSDQKRSGVEVTKENSRHLRGGLVDQLSKDTEKFDDGEKNLIKFHGSYQQEDRDARKSRRGEGLGKFHIFMVRCKIPGGKMTADQYLGMDALANKYANGTIRFTSRQSIQFHGIVKKDLKTHIRGINDTLLTTFGACGDVNRNVMACPAPQPGPRAEIQVHADAIAAHLTPRTQAYHEIWLDGKPQPESGNEFEPIYGKVYLPRKFKIGLGLPEDNCVDVFAQDLGFLAYVEGGHVAGYDVFVGGGMGKTHGNARTFPFLGKAMCYVEAARVVEMSEAVVKLFRDHGDRGDRKRARIKYVVHDWGVDKFREVLATYAGPLTSPRGLTVSGFDLHLGAHPMGDGRWWYGVSVENGRVKDEGTRRMRSGLRAVVERFKPEVRLTPMQDVLLCGLSTAQLAEVQRMLDEYGVPRPETISPARQHSMACPAIPTCGLAISESERVLPAIIDELDAKMKELGLDREVLGVRATGCPNGCVRPYQSDIGIVGRSGEKYVLFVGGSVRGDRLNYELRDLTPRGEIVKTLEPLLRRFKEQRQPNESFGDFCARIGEESARAT
ncbi:MAG: NADPH-dependent assimilatory sulfite reductase hemoprotein subunit [Planctomycetia bacterium]|nr:NADPH-dependent assimilatory sulfite reductase hemoprotein subunit [Planctomycetia bacterium]